MEYEALIANLRETSSLNIKNLQIYGYYQLIVEQVKGGYQIKNDKMTQYRDLALDVLSQFSSYTIQILPRKDNWHANAMASTTSFVCLENNAKNF